jgi:hypothetical protein
MSYTVPFTETEYTPHSIPGNLEADAPVRFYLSAAGGPDLARLKSILYASGGLSSETDWSAALQRDVAAAFAHGAELFTNTVDRIEGMTVPAAMAIKAGILQADPTRPIDRQAPIVIDTGAKFARVCGWLTVLAFEVAMKIAELSREVDADTRFFGSSTTSPKTPATASGSAPGARKPRGPRAIAASGTTTGHGGATSGR